MNTLINPVFKLIDVKISELTEYVDFWGRRDRSMYSLLNKTMTPIFSIMFDIGLTDSSIKRSEV